MLTITIIGTTPPCVKCKRAEQEALKAAAQHPNQVQVRKIDALSEEADGYGIIVTPAVVVGGQLIANGKILAAEQLSVHIKRVLGG
ncbi:MAG: thioredoxin family protein [Anaerolineae bacterium]